MSVFTHPEFDNHEHVSFVRDAATGLKAIIAIHDTALGPAAGGVRMWPYADEDAALRDVLRLSRGMTFKNAIAGLPLGGGKSIIIGDSRSQKTAQLLRAFGRQVETLAGRYLAAEDVGVSVADMEEVARETRFVFGRSPQRGWGGDPSPMTALGVAVGLEAAVQSRLNRRSLQNVTVAVQGVGHVGYHLCKILHERGAKLIVADVDAAAVVRAVAEFGAKSVDPDGIVRQAADVFAPCALGAVLNDQSIPELQAPIVGGAANNQLAGPRDGFALKERGILYAPDYVINAGGIINVASEIGGKYDRDRVVAKVMQIGKTLSEMFERARAESLPTSEVADRMAKIIIRKARASRRGPEQAAAACRA